MKASYKRVKGANLERKVAELLRKSGLDKQAKRSFQSGAQWAWKSDIYTKIPYAIECKNQEKICLWAWWEQTESQRKPYKSPVLMLTSNFRPILAVMKIEDWINLIKENEELKQIIEEKKEGREEQ